MERLTNNTKLGFQDSNKLPSYEGLWDRLRYYEELEEEGKLIKLPCKVGSTVYILRKEKFIHHFGVEKGGVVKATVHGISKDNYEIKYYFHYTFGWEKICFEGDNSIFGKDVFLTREEAKEKLKEQSNER